MNGNTNEERFRRTLYRYLPQELAEELLNRDDASLGGERQDVSILFSDIHNASALTQSLEAEQAVALFNDYFEPMVEAIFKYQGTLDKYLGAGIMAVFGSPVPRENHAWCAVQTAVEMHHQLAQLNARRVAINQPPIRIGIGINSDSVISGNIGSSKRMEFTVVGHGVNLASSLEGVSKQYGCNIVISNTTYRACTDRIWARELDLIRIKGQGQPLPIYEVVGLRSEPISEQKRQAIELYHTGRNYYLNRQFRKAWNKFATIVDELAPDDRAAKLLMERSQHLVNNPPSDDWDGVWIF